MWCLISWMLCLISWLQHLLFTLAVAIAVRIYVNEGGNGLVKAVLLVLKALPGVGSLISTLLQREVGNFVNQVQSDDKKSTNKPPRVLIPKTAIPHKELLEEMEKLQAAQIKPQDGKIFAYVYTMEDDAFELQKEAYSLFCEKTGLTPEHDQFVKTFHQAFMHENALNPMVFPALRKFENEVVSMAAGMLNGDSEVVGSLTSGGTESILMAMKTYRDRARKLFPHITEPEMVAPITIHPAHEKAAYYFGFKIVHVPIKSDFTLDIRKYEEAITPNTIALLASAPQYCHGIVDPLEELSNIAVNRGLPLHVDACFGGFMMPWVEKLGYPVPNFDFRLPGLFSITADLHKYGFSTKGASVVLYRNADIRKHQIFAYSQWPGGLFGSPSMAGTRPGGNIAAAWATLKSIGEDGYMKVAKQLMETTEKLKDGVCKIPGLCVVGKPYMTAFAIGSSDSEVDILALADVMETRGWKMERNQKPSSLHCTIMPHHTAVADTLLKDLEESALEVRKNKTLANKGTAAMYGMVANIPDEAILDEFIVHFFSEVYKA